MASWLCCIEYAFLFILYIFISPFLEKIRQRYAELSGELHIIELEKDKNGLGLSLAGNKDRSRMSIFVVGISPDGPAGKDGRMHIGDELLEVIFGYIRLIKWFYRSW